MYSPRSRHLLYVILITALVIAVAACGGTPTPTPVPPTATPVPPTATLTRLPATATPVPPTATPVPPTATSAPPTATTIPPTATKAPAAGSGTASPAERDLVGAAFVNLAKATSFGMKATVEGQSTTIPFSGDIVMEVVQTPSRSVYLKLGDQIEMIVIGEDAYLKLASAPWQKSPVAPAQIQQLGDVLDFAKSVKPEDLTKMDISKAGSEKVDGVDTDMFDLVIPRQQPQKTRVWISRSGKMLVKQMLEDQGGRISISFYGWNSVKVEAPKI